MCADKGPEGSTVSRIVNNGMLINFRKNQRGQAKIQSSRTSNIEHKRHIVKTKKSKLTILKNKQMSNTDPTKAGGEPMCSSRVSSSGILI